MANDGEYQAEVHRIMAEFAQADWEALKAAEIDAVSPLRSGS